jgi:NodT family efflux transporter outer membrane factor (OMF) lipoprotein
VGGAGVAASVSEGSDRLTRSVKAIAALIALALAGCAEVGPDYQRPSAIVSPAYKELKGWKAATPRDDAQKGQWWTAFHDPVLNRLETQVAVSNQTLKADEANYRQALALISEARAGLFPTVNVDGSFTRQSPGEDVVVGELNAAWTLDVWGKIRRTIEEQGASAQASAATLANATLSAQSALATAYVTLREAESARDLYDDTVKQYQRSLEITQNQYNAGVAAKSDVITAQAQVLATQALAVETDVSRQQSEHAIAVLIGKPPAELSIARGKLTDVAPSAPISVPSALLERRPDIAAAERQMASANAAIGVAIAGYYPDITLSGLFGYSGNPFLTHGSLGNPVWNYALQLAEPVFNGGLTDAQVAAARATYDSEVATYRQTVLDAFQQVEDALVGVRVYGDTIKIQVQAVDAAQQAVQIALNEYKAGTQSFTTVVTAEATALTDQQNLLSARASRLTSTVNLIVALGGGWSETKLPDPLAH